MPSPRHRHVSLLAVLLAFASLILYARYCFYDDGEVLIAPANAAASTAAAATATHTDAHTTEAAVTGAPTAVSDCHLHGTTV